MPSISFENVDLTYQVYGAAGRSLKLALMRQVVGSRVDLGIDDVEVAALSEVSFELAPGDRLGLVGHNGSGKSTILRLIARLTYPTRGRLRIKGRVLPLIEKGLGINPELTGMENIELPLRLLGANAAEVRSAKRDVPEFAALGAFIHMPVRTYSEGMLARLAFALCTSIDCDIIVLDEWLSAGDIEFVERARARLDALLERSGIVVLATHSLDLMQSVCNKVAWMDRGRLKLIGEASTVLGAYRSDALASASQ
jgi:ABC-type polysaccharide/polyol phosphate transport system ATPase subunit